MNMRKSVDWQINEVSEPLKKKKSKPWGIDSRYSGPIDFIHKEWEVYKWYATERARDTALSALQSKNRSPDDSFEYRKSDGLYED